MPTRNRYTFYLDDDLAAALDQIRERDGISTSEQIRRAIRAWTESKGIKAPERKRAGRRRTA